MDNNLARQSLSQVPSNPKHKNPQFMKLNGSFQQLYELLSKQTISVSKIDHQYLRKSIDNTQNHQRVNLEYTPQPERFAILTQPSKYAQNDKKATIQSQQQQSSSDLAFKIRKKTTVSVNQTNQKLKNIILGKKVKKIAGKASAARIATDPPREVQRESNLLLQKKLSTAERSSQKARIQKHINQVKCQLKQINQKVGLSCYLVEASPKHRKGITSQKQHHRFKIVKENKKLAIIGDSKQKNTQKASQPQFKKVVKFKDDFKLNYELLKRKNKQSEVLKNPQIEVQTPPKIKKKSELDIVINNYSPQQLVSEHIYIKLIKMIDFGDFLLSSFNSRLHHQTPQKLPKFSRKNKFYSFYVGPGNNRSLVVEMISKRWWWKEVPEIENANFVWTQQKVSQLLRMTTKDQLIVSEAISERQKQKAVKLVQIKKSIQVDEQKKIRINLLTSHKSGIKVQNSNTDELQTVVQPKCFHNHLSDSKILGDKKYLFKLLKAWKVNYQKKDIQDLFQIIPQTYHITSHQSFDFRYFQQIFQLKSSLWIIKPGQDSNRGRDIFVSSSFQQIQQAVKARYSLGGTTIIQKYQSELLLYRGRKFDIRTFVLCVFIGEICKYYWFSHGYIRTSSHQFNVQNLDMMIHLTNDAIQIQGDNYGKFQKGNKLSYHQLQTYLKEAFPQKQLKVDNLIIQMKDSAKELAQSSYCLIDRRSNNHGFELFGLDFIVDSDFKPWLLEVNTNPCLETTSPLLQTMIPNLLDNVFKLSVDPLFPATMYPDKEHEHILANKIEENNKFQLIFDSLTQRDQYWQTFCMQNGLDSPQNKFQ